MQHLDMIVFTWYERGK